MSSTFCNLVEPADVNLLLLPDAKGIVELAATRLIKESTASRVRDILMACQVATVNILHQIRETARTKFCYKVKKHGQCEPMSYLAENSNVSVLKSNTGANRHIRKRIIATY